MFEMTGLHFFLVTTTYGRIVRQFPWNRAVEMCGSCQESMASAILSLLAEDYRALVLAPETLCVQLQTRCLLIDEVKYEYIYIYLYIYYIYIIYIYYMIYIYI